MDRARNFVLYFPLFTVFVFLFYFLFMWLVVVCLSAPPLEEFTWAYLKLWFSYEMINFWLSIPPQAAILAWFNSYLI